ncbi:unnamed protein product, partial [Rotaria sp. Silwood2]
TGNQPTTKLEFSTPVRSLTPDLYSRVPSSIKRSRITPALASSMHEPPIYTPRSVMSELGPQSPTSSATKRPFSDVSNRTTIGRSFTGNQPTTKLEFSTPVRSLTPDLYSRVPSSIKRSRITPALASS